MTTIHASLTDRYVAAVLVGVSADRRPEVEARLRDAIRRDVDKRLADGQSADDAERAALMGLGDPMRVSAGYSDRELHLIGPDLYPDYIRLLRLLLIVVVPIVAVVIGTVTALSGVDLWGVLTASVGTAFTVGVQVAFWVTVAFALIDRYGGRARASTSTWDLDDLPEPPSRGVSLGGTIGSVIGLGLLAWFLLWQPGYQESFDPGGPSIPILDPALDQFWIPFLVVVVLASIALEIVKHVVGRWTVPIAAVNTVLTLAFAVPVVWLASTDQLLNPTFVSTITGEAWASAVAWVPVLISWLIVVLSVIDIADGWWKALKGAT
jgi:hypothetical protein